MSNRLRDYGLSLAASALAVAVLLPLHGALSQVNVAMLLLLVVASIAAVLGRGPAIVASVVAVLAFDIGFVSPRGSLSVDDAEYIIVFAVMLAVALMISQISGRLRTRALQAQADEARQRELYELAAALNGTLRSAQVIDVVATFARKHLDAVARFHPPQERTTDPLLPSVEVSGQAAQDGDGPPERPLRFLHPLIGATRSRGVLEVQLPRSAQAQTSANFLPVVAGLMAAALERLHYLDVAARVQTEVETERLRNALLTSLSHDLRTPLTVLHAQADRLREHAAGDSALARQAAVVCEEALRVSRLSEGLLDLARLGGAAVLNCDWVGLEELIGSALAGLRGVAGIEHLSIRIPADLPWLRLDAPMFERVIANLVDNALKQGAAGQQVSIEAFADATSVSLLVANSGSRFAPGVLEAWQTQDRNSNDVAIRGLGLGLSICRAVIETHGGQIRLRNGAQAAEVEVSLPLPTQTMSQPPPDADAAGAPA
jgi:two-component system sensor histidine kinase KdpD